MSDPNQNRRTPDYVSECGRVTLYRADCREVLPEIGRVDHVITDPPYAEKTHSGARTGAADRILVTFDSVNDGWIVDFAALLLRSTKRWVVMTCDWRHSATLDAKYPDEFIRAGVWVKPNGMPQYTGDRPAMGWESVAILHNKGRKIWKGGGRHAVWTIPKVNGDHPTEKPIALILSFVELFTDTGDLVCDPCMGSGTTGVACIRTGRRFIGIEIDPKYFSVAVERIERELRQPYLIPPTPPEQDALL